MNKILYWFYVVIMLLCYAVYYMLSPFVWLQSKVADACNFIDEQTYDYKLTKQFKTKIENKQNGII